VVAAVPPWWVEGIGLVAGIIGSLISLPQVIRIARLRTDAGVSIWTWLILSVLNSAWIAYGIHNQSFSQIVTSVMSGGITGVLTVQLLRYRMRLLYAILIMVGAWIVVFVAEFYSPPAVGSAILLVGLVSRAPQVIESLKSWRQGRPTAVSNRTYIMSIVASILWVTYAVIGSFWTLAIFSSSVILLSVIILSLEAATRRKVHGAEPAPMPLPE
jgi:uncharacterized protein with PQ loop repeat